MRQDIEIHINTGDINLVSNVQYTERPFQWVTNPSGLTRYIYGEIALPASIPDSTLEEEGIYFTIPYTPIYKEFYVRIKRYYSDNNFFYKQNPVDGTEWFLVKVRLYGGEEQNAFASQLRLVSEKSFHLVFNRGTALLFSSEQSDFNIIPVNRQNTNLMLACVPTNNYRYPISGVGLIRWTQSKMLGSDLAEVLHREFSEDGVAVVNANYDFDTNDLQLELDTSNVD